MGNKKCIPLICYRNLKLTFTKIHIMNNPKSFFLTSLLMTILFFTFSCTKQEDTPKEPQVNLIEQTLDLEEGSTTLFESTEANNAVLNLQFSGNTSIVIKIKLIADNEGTTRIIERTLEPGRAFIEEFPQLLSLHALVPVLSVPVVAALNFQIATIPTDGDNGFSASDWLSAGKICLNGEVESEPDQNIDCLWETETLWQAVSERDIDLNITLTGKHDMKVEIEGPVGIFQVYNVSAAPALPQFQVLSGQWEGVVAVHIHCIKSPVNPCESCDYTYSLCYE